MRLIAIKHWLVGKELFMVLQCEALSRLHIGSSNGGYSLPI